jgi:hypothetical protein
MIKEASYRKLLSRILEQNLLGGLLEHQQKNIPTKSSQQKAGQFCPAMMKKRKY